MQLITKHKTIYIVITDFYLNNESDYKKRKFLGFIKDIIVDNEIPRNRLLILDLIKTMRINRELITYYTHDREIYFAIYYSIFGNNNTNKAWINKSCCMKYFVFDLGERVLFSQFYARRNLDYDEFWRHEDVVILSDSDIEITNKCKFCKF
jgi:hypothetical protein